MKPITTSLIHRVMMPETGAAGPHPTLVLLHGRGADEDDLVGITQYFDERLLVLSVRAPFPFEYGGFTWYDAGPDGTPDAVRFGESHERLAAFLDDIVQAYPVDPARLFLLGFSMGAAMSLVAALTRPHRVRGVSVNSGYLPERVNLEYQWDAVGPMQMILAHGTLDPVIPVERARRAHTLLAARIPSLRYTEYVMGHEMSQESIRDVAQWMGPLV